MWKLESRNLSFFGCRIWKSKWQTVHNTRTLIHTILLNILKWRENHVRERERESLTSSQLYSGTSICPSSSFSVGIISETSREVFDNWRDFPSGLLNYAYLPCFYCLYNNISPKSLVFSSKILNYSFCTKIKYKNDYANCFLLYFNQIHCTNNLA